MSENTWFIHELSCPLCAGPVDLISKSAPSVYVSQFVVTCKPCERDMVIKVNLVVLYHPADDHNRTSAHRAKDAKRQRIRRARLAAAQ